MIRDYHPEDIFKINANDFGNQKILYQRINSDRINKFTMTDKDKVIAIILYAEVSKNRIQGAFVISKDFTAKHAKELKRELFSWVTSNKIKSMETDSQDNPVIEKWHKFLGFTKTDQETVVNGHKLIRWTYGN